MSEYLKKEGTLFERDESGELLPVEVIVESLDNAKILVRPIPKGKMNELALAAKTGETSKNTDDLIILDHCIEPKYTEEEITRLNLKMTNALALSIYALSLGLDQKTIEEQQVKTAVDNQNAELKKN